MRCIWVNEVRIVAEKFPNSCVPWYLTLCGGEGRDIELLIQEDLISRTEVNSIAERDLDKIVAVENNVQAYVKLRKRFPGLRIKDVDFQDLMRGTRFTRWPDGKDEVYCKARVVNLDLNQPFRGEMIDEKPLFPVLSWIHKLCILHQEPTQIDWTLCLTLHGEVNWADGVSEWINEFLAGNLKREKTFASSCRDFLGTGLFSKIESCGVLDFRSLDRDSQQKIIMIIVPKYIANSVHNLGWSVFTERNLRYVDERHAPMVTWILKFTWSGRATSQPDVVYRSSLKDIFAGAGIVNDSGEIETTAY